MTVTLGQKQKKKKKKKKKLRQKQKGRVSSRYEYKIRNRKTVKGGKRSNTPHSPGNLIYGMVQNSGDVVYSILNSVLTKLYSI